MDNQEQVLVTIKCITYNQSKYIRQALDGFLIQKTNFKYEVIVHDDASTDGTTEIIKEYEKKYPQYIKPIYQTENQYSQKGFPYITRLFLKEAKGKYFAQCEGDDYWTDPFKLQKQVDFLESHPDFSMCFHQGMIHYENDGRPDEVATLGLEDREYTGLELYRTFRPITCSVVTRMEVLHSKVYQDYLDSSIPFGDLPLFLSCAHCGRIWGMTDKMAIYRKHDSGATSVLKKPDERMLSFFANGHLQIYKIFGDTYKEQSIKIYVMEYINFIQMAYQTGQYRMDLLAKIFMEHPIYTIKFLYKRICLSLRSNSSSKNTNLTI